MFGSQNRGLTAQAAYTPSGGDARLREYLRSLDESDLRAAVWAALLVGIASLVAAVLAVLGDGVPPLWVLLVLVGAEWIAERQGVMVSDRVEMSVSFLPTVFTAIVFGPLAAFVVGVLSTGMDIRRPYLRWLVYTQISAIAGATCALVVGVTQGVASGLGGYLLASAVACCVWVTVDVGLGFITFAIRRGDVRSYLRSVGPFFLVSIPLCFPLLALFVYGYHTYSLWVAVALLVPVVALQRLIHLYQRERDARRNLTAANTRLASANLSFATALVATLDARDQYTAGHSAATAIYARDIVARMGLPDREQNLAHLCGLVHDVGKIGLSAGLLEKPGALTLEERRQMEKHAEIGEYILKKVTDYGEIAKIVRHHHERVDGLGYPDGLQAAEIPLLSRVLAVADAYNAMTSDRPYRDALPSRVARLRLAQAAESQFDTSIVAAFEAILAGADEAYRMGRSEAFALAGEITRPPTHDGAGCPSLGRLEPSVVSLAG